MDQSVLDDIINRLLEVRGRPGKQVQLSEAEIRQLCVSSRDFFLQQPNLLELQAPIKICGTSFFPKPTFYFHFFYLLVWEIWYGFDVIISFLVYFCWNFEKPCCVFYMIELKLFFVCVFCNLLDPMKNFGCLSKNPLGVFILFYFCGVWFNCFI